MGLILKISAVISTVIVVLLTFQMLSSSKR
jgi:hypothetical protein